MPSKRERDRLGRSSRRPVDWFAYVENGAKECVHRANVFGETPKTAGGRHALPIFTEYSQLGNWNSDARNAALETGNWKPDTRFPVNIELINTGSELMLGQVLNTHQQWICRQLADHGYSVTRQVAVADAGPDIQQAVREAL